MSARSIYTIQPTFIPFTLDAIYTALKSGTITHRSISCICMTLMKILFITLITPKSAGIIIKCHFLFSWACVIVK